MLQRLSAQTPATRNICSYPDKDAGAVRYRVAAIVCLDRQKRGSLETGKVCLSVASGRARHQESNFIAEFLRGSSPSSSSSAVLLRGCTQTESPELARMACDSHQACGFSRRCDLSANN